MNQLEIEIGDTVRIAESSKYYDDCLIHNPKCNGIYEEDDGTLTHAHYVRWENGKFAYYNLSDLTLIKKGKTMQFTKSDLKTGMFVKQRDGDYAIVLDKSLSTISHYTSLSKIQSGLQHDTVESNDIMAVYTAASRDTLGCHLKGASLTLIWERTEQTEAQKEMVVLQEQAKALQEQITKLQGKL
jgi:hypothetical protein